MEALIASDIKLSEYPAECMLMLGGCEVQAKSLISLGGQVFVVSCLGKF